MLDSPKTKLYETLAYIGCAHAQEKNTISGAVNSIWSHFQGLAVSNVVGSTLCFWGDEGSYGETTEAIDLIELAHANCVAWSRLLNDCWLAQGISGGQLVEITPKVFTPASGTIAQRQLLINKWIMAPVGTAPAGASPYTHRVGFEAHLGDRIASQGHVLAPANLFSHTIVSFNNKLYDPSYGQGPFNGGIDHENAALAGTVGTYSDGVTPPLHVVKVNSNTALDTDSNYQ